MNTPDHSTNVRSRHCKSLVKTLDMLSNTKRLFTTVDHTDLCMKRPNNTCVIRDPSQPHTGAQCVHYNQLKPYPPPRSDSKPSTSSYLLPISHIVEISTSDPSILSEH
ncbi:hypothetical protein CSKR_105636 [Clonorchis sinensis]|uniref:Uncharacterized protein n=1 Tax=Clonorchis sinensis TaxID=79923 RepID=A0A3R7GUE7_CLOSI|nr:hypothetical protein CSKR_105636 [Clonorchis sinensis]